MQGLLPKLRTNFEILGVNDDEMAMGVGALRGTACWMCYGVDSAKHDSFSVLPRQNAVRAASRANVSAFVCAAHIPITCNDIVPVIRQSRRVYDQSRNSIHNTWI
jgi:hypothetical protein